MVNISMQFHEDILNGFQATERTRLFLLKLLLTKFKGASLKNIYIQELWFLRSAHCLTLINISMTFHEDTLNGFQVTELQIGRHCILFSA